MRHVDRLQKGNCTIELGFVLTDLLTNLERVSDHCSNIAIVIVELLDENALDIHELSEAIQQQHLHQYEKFFDEYGLAMATEALTTTEKPIRLVNITINVYQKGKMGDASAKVYATMQSTKGE